MNPMIEDFAGGELTQVRGRYLMLVLPAEVEPA